MSLPALSGHRKGLALTAIGGLVLSMDIPLVRLAEGKMWPILGLRSITTVLVTLLIVAAIGVHDGISSGHIFGDATALLSALILGAAITVGRASRRDMGFVPLLAAMFPAILGFGMALPAGVSIDHPGWIIFNGAIVMPVAFWCLATGPRYLPAPEVGMFYLLETVLAPIWVWFIFAEIPTAMTLMGGAILFIAIMMHSLWMARGSGVRQRR